MDRCNVMCNKLWDEVYIDYSGSVYSCCHEYPGILGNIYTNTLDDIINNSLIRKYRKDAMNGQLKCRKECNISPKNVALNINQKDKLFANHHFEVLKILFGEKCNINCIMCWQNSKKKEIIDFDMIKKNVNIAQFKHVLIQGGEIFACKEALQFARYVMKAGVEVSFLTNGTLITSEWAERIVKNSTFIHISINAATKQTHEIVNCGSSWEKVLSNVRMLRMYKEMYHSNLCIKGHMTIIKENVDEIPLFIKNFEDLGFDMARFGYDQSVVQYLNEHRQYTEQLKERIKCSIEEKGLENVDITRLQILGLI